MTSSMFKNFALTVLASSITFGTSGVEAQNTPSSGAASTIAVGRAAPVDESAGGESEGDPFGEPAVREGHEFGRGYGGYGGEGGGYGMGSGGGMGRGGMMRGSYGTDASTGSDPLHQQEHAFTDTTRILVAQYQKSTDENERQTLSDELAKVVTEHFELRQQMRERELKDLEAQVRRLRELHDRREKEKDQIVNDRLRHLLRDAEGLGWGAKDSADVRDSRFMGVPSSDSDRFGASGARK